MCCVKLIIIPSYSFITAIIQPEGYNMYNCVYQIMEQDYTATKGRLEFCILTLLQCEYNV